jgi:hypothetical protein
VRLPKVICPPDWARPEGGRPPLACGIGAGEGTGEGIGTLPGMGIGPETFGCGVLWATAGDSANPNWIEDRGPLPAPFAPRPDGVCEPMVTEGVRLWFPGPPFRPGPWAAEVVGFMVGTAGGIKCRPFTGEAEEGVLACCEAGAAEPTTTDGVLEPVATSGFDAVFFVPPAADA